MAPFPPAGAAGPAAADRRDWCGGGAGARQHHVAEWGRQGRLIARIDVIVQEGDISPAGPAPDLAGFATMEQ